jgi:lipopolysaccharide export system protein LptC
MDEVKKYLFENRDELDLEKAPRPQVWKHIQRETAITPKPAIPVMTRWIAAAAAVVVVAASLLFWLQRPTSNEAQQVTAGKNNPAINPEKTGQVDSVGTVSVQENKEDNSEPPAFDIPKEHKAPAHLARKSERKPATVKKQLSPLEAVDDNYATMISNQLRKLETTPIYTEDAGYFHVFKKQWFDLQKDEQKLKQEVRLYGLTDNVVTQLIQLYQQKLWLLKELQSEITKMNIRAKQHPALERKNPAFLKL